MAFKSVWEIIVSRNEKPMGMRRPFGVWYQWLNQPDMQELLIRSVRKAASEEDYPDGD
jgi:hypothetical protein